MNTTIQATMQIDDTCISHFQQGHEKAFGIIFKVFDTPLTYFAQKITGNREDAEDIVSGIFLKLWKRRSDFRSFVNIKAFLYISTRNACLDYLRAKQRTQPTEPISANLLQDSDHQHSKLMDRSDIFDLAMTAISKMTGQKGAIMRLAFIDGLENHEIAGRLELTKDVVKALKSRGLLELRAIVASYKPLINTILFFIACLYYLFLSAKFIGIKIFSSFLFTGFRL